MEPTQFHPVDLESAITYLISINKEDMKNILAYTEGEATTQLHHRYGRYLRNEWFLWWFEDHKYETWPKSKPEIVKYFNEIDIFHADDMSSIILTSFFKRIHNLPLDIEEQVERYKSHWRNQGYTDGIPKMN